MAPLGFHQHHISHTVHSTTMTVGSSPFPMGPQIGQLPPAHLALPPELTAAIHEDHDYVIKPKVLQMAPQAVAEEPFSADAMLSSSALDFDTIMNDIDFTDDLADLNLGLDDLDAGEDFNMEETFQDFIDSALDKSFNPQQWEAEEAKARERTEKEDFMRAMGLVPVLSNPNGDSTNCGVSDTRHFSVSEMTPVSTAADVPTKQCKCSQNSDGSRAVYTTAGLRSPNVLSPSTSQQFRLPPHPAVSLDTLDSNTFPTSSSRVIGPCLNCIQNRDVLREFSKPLTIDVSLGQNDMLAFQCLGQERSYHCEGPRIPEPQTLQDPDEEELIQWLNSSQSSTISPSTQDTTTYQNSTPQGSKQENVDFESYMDLEDFLSEDSTTNPCQPIVQHDHTYQKAACNNNIPCATTQAESSTQQEDSFSATEAPISKDNFQDFFSEVSTNTPKLDLGDSSSSSGHSSPYSSPTSSPYPSPGSRSFHINEGSFKYEKDHLDILNFFSDDLSSSMLSAGSPVAHLRFM